MLRNAIGVGWNTDQRMLALRRCMLQRLVLQGAGGVQFPEKHYISITLYLKGRFFSHFTNHFLSTSGPIDALTSSKPVDESVVTTLTFSVCRSSKSPLLS